MKKYPLEFYGRWSGNEKGKAYDKTKCAYEVFDWIGYQCSRKKGHGKDGLFCKQHAKIIESWRVDEEDDQ